MKHRKLKTATVLVIILAVWTWTHVFGPLDTYSRVQHIAESSDGAWRFVVYQRKLEPLNPFADAETVFRVEDVRGQKVKDQRLWRTAWWTGFGWDKNFNVRFERDVIIVNDFWVADKTELRFKACPLLRCLTEPD